MLLSDHAVIQFLKSEVVPCWESLRSVPVVTLDAGDGRVLKRTLGGNTALFLCSPQGEVVDVYPGVLTPEDFLSVVAEGLSILRDSGQGDLRQRVRSFHAQGQSGGAMPSVPVPISASKAVVEGPILRGLRGRSDSRITRISPTGLELTEDLSKQAASSTDILTTLGLPTAPDRGLGVVAADSHQNRTEVRQLVHRLLAAQPRLLTPSELRGPVFKDILHLDLDDPWLGLLEHEIPGSPRR